MKESEKDLLRYLLVVAEEVISPEKRVDALIDFLTTRNIDQFPFKYNVHELHVTEFREMLGLVDQAGLDRVCSELKEVIRKYIRIEIEKARVRGNTQEITELNSIKGDNQILRNKLAKLENYLNTQKSGSGTANINTINKTNMSWLKSATLLQWTIILIGIFTVAVGFYFQAGSVQAIRGNSGKVLQHDSSFTEITKTDSSFYVDSAAKPAHRGLTRTITKQISTTGEKVPKDLGELGYKYILFGTALLLFMLVLPSLQEFNFFNLFSGKFRAMLETKKAESNAVEEDLARPSEAPTKITERKQKQVTFTPSGEAVEKDISVLSYENDPQKGKWGGKSENNSRKLIATVTPDLGNREWFNIELKVMSTDFKKPLTGKVQFHLHNTFINSTPFIYVKDGVASLKVKAYGAFTVGAEADRGNTQLELDLSELPNAPRQFVER
ncbi:MAG TPA: hypothetical protein PKM91_17025 [Cyclobacteriaceae bacterium]|nr:hypothetical protein [Cyclobacteriaceae bacterium]